MGDSLLTAGQAAEILDMSPGGASNILGEPEKLIKLVSGHVVRVWLESKIREIHEDRKKRGVKVRTRQETSHMRNGMYFDPEEHKHGKSFDFEVARFGKVIPQKKTFRGRTCRYEGCKVEVSTGKLYCDDHSAVYKAMQKNVATHGEAFLLSRR